jgi:hypothetical protein
MDTNEPSDQPQRLVPARIQANPIAIARPMAVAPAADEAGPAVSLQVVMRALTRHWWQILALCSIRWRWRWRCGVRPGAGRGDGRTVRVEEGDPDEVGGGRLRLM